MPLGRVVNGVSDLAFQVGTLARAGVIGSDRPDRAIRALAALVAGGTTPSTALEVAAIKNGDRTFIIDPKGSLTFAQAKERVEALAAGLSGIGMTGERTAAIMCRNHRGFLEAMLASSRLGATTVFLNTMFSAPQLAEVVESEGVDFLFLDREFEDLLEGVPDRVVAITADGPDPDGGLDNESLITAGRGGGIPGSPGNPRFIILTSGTTGSPKGAQRSSPKGLESIAGLLDLIPHRARETMVIAAPIFHSWGFVNAVLALTLGATIVLDGRFDPKRTIELVAEHDAEVLVAVPVMLQRILELDPEPLPAGQPGSLKITTLSGSALPGDLAIRWMDRFGDNVYNLYGSTEVSFVSIAVPADLRRHPSTAGRLPRGTSVRLLDESGREVPTGEAGRIFVGNDMAFDGYTGGADKERIEGFVSSGDVGHFDREGLLYVDGRDDEMIVSGGENVFPAEVEDLIAAMDGVVEVAVVGVDDERFGQALSAYVVLRKGSELDGDAIRAEVRAGLASYKVPREVAFLEELPRNATGKVLKRLLGR